MASKANSESMVGDISTRTPEIVEQFYEYLNGDNTDLNSHGRRWLRIIVERWFNT